MKAIAMLSRSDGNSEVGSMWTETKVFTIDSRIEDVLVWAIKRTHNLGGCIRETLTLQIADEGEVVE